MKLVSLGFLAIAGLALPSWLQAADVDVEKVTVRASAHFGFDREAIRPADRAKLLAEVGKMKDVTWQSVTATGYTDAVGRADYNEKLSDRRARSVKSYLVGKGLDPAMIQVVGKGEVDPVADNGTSSGRAQNRRTEVEFQGVRSKPR